jgi:hypothetical protein
LYRAGAVKKFKEEISQKIESVYEIIDALPSFEKKQVQKSFEVY